MDKDKILLTEEGLKKLQDELNHRKTVERERIANDIERARQQGDLSENSAYKASMEDKEFNEVKITELEAQISKAEIVKKGRDINKVQLGSKVMLLDIAKNTKREFNIVGDNEADPTNNKISFKSPLAVALMGKKIKDKIEFSIPAGKINYEILNID